MPKHYKRKSRRGGKSFAKRVKAVMIRTAESKYFDANGSQASIISTTDTGTAYNQLMSPQIIQGDTVNNREGNSVLMKSAKCNYLFTALSSCSARLIVLLIDRVKDNDLTSALAGDWDASAVGLMGQYPREPDGYRYNVLMDRIFNLDPDSKGSIRGSRTFKINKKVQYLDNTTGAPISNAVYLLVYTNQTVANDLAFEANVRNSFADI